MARTPMPAPLWALPLAPQRVHSKPSISLLLVPEAGPLVDARLVNSSAVPPFKPQKVSSLLVSLFSFSFLVLGGEGLTDYLHPRNGFGTLFNAGVPSFPPALRPFALLFSVLFFPLPPRMTSCGSFAST